MTCRAAAIGQGRRPFPGTIAGSIHSVAVVVEEIAAATREQSTGIEQVSQTIAHVDEDTQKNAAVVEESATTAQAKAEVEQLAQRNESHDIFFP